MAEAPGQRGVEFEEPAPLTRALNIGIAAADPASRLKLLKPPQLNVDRIGARSESAPGVCYVTDIIDYLGKDLEQDNPSNIARSEQLAALPHR